MTSGTLLSKRVVLPSAIHALAGHEINIYFDTVVPNFNPYREYLEIKADIGTHLDARWNFFPDERDIGIHTVLIRLIDADDGSVITAETQVHVAKPTTGSGKEIAWLMIGDSLTHQSHYPERILDLCGSPGNPHIRLIGSHHLDGFSENNRHEGYGGWTAKHFTTLFLAPDDPNPPHRHTSPFVFAGESGPELDIPRYLELQAEGAAPDIVTILLGGNDIAYANEENIEASLDEMIAHSNLLIGAFQTISPKTEIAMITPPPPTISQDGFGENYGCAISRQQYRRNLHWEVARIISEYDNRKSEHIHVVPAYYNFDAAHAYPIENRQVHSNSDVTSPRVVNALHPTPEGYRQLADSIYFWMKSLYP